MQLKPFYTKKTFFEFHCKFQQSTFCGFHIKLLGVTFQKYETNSQRVKDVLSTNKHEMVVMETLD